MKMTSKIFKIKWPDDFGPEWLCKENLEACLFSKTKISSDIPIVVIDLTKEEE